MKTSKEVLVTFLENWKSFYFGKMYDSCQITWKSNHDKNALKTMFEDRIKSYQITKVTEINSCKHDIEVTVKIKGVKKHLKARLLKEKVPFKTDESGEFGVNPISIIKGVREYKHVK